MESQEASQNPDPRRARNRKLMAAYGTGAIARALGVMAPLALIPMLLNYLGEVRFGAWATILSLTSMFVFADLGIGSSLLTRLSWMWGKENRQEGRVLIANSYLAATGVAVGLSLLFLAVALLLDPAELLNVQEESMQDDVRLIVALLIGAFLISIPLGLIVRIQLAVQQAWQSSLWMTSGQLLSIPIAWILIQLQAPPAAVVLGVALGPVIGMLINTLAFFLSKTGRSLRPQAALANRAGLKEIMTVGVGFSFISIFSNISINSDNLVVAASLGVADVAVLTVASRLFRSTTMAVALIGMPLWGANGEALSRGDTAWIRRTTRRAIVGLVGITSLIGLLLVLLRDFVIGVWVGGDVPAPFALYAGLAVWSTVYSVVTPLFMVHNAAGHLRSQTIGWSSYLVISLPAKYLGVETFGLSAIPWVGVICFSFTVLPAAILGYRKVLSQSHPLPSAATDGPQPPLA